MNAFVVCKAIFPLMNDKSRSEIGDGEITKTGIMHNFSLDNGKQNQGKPKHSMHDDVQASTLDFFISQVSNEKEGCWKNAEKQYDPMVIKWTPVSRILRLKQANLVGDEFLYNFLVSSCEQKHEPKRAYQQSRQKEKEYFSKGREVLEAIKEKINGKCSTD